MNPNAVIIGGTAVFAAVALSGVTNIVGKVYLTLLQKSKHRSFPLYRHGILIDPRQNSRLKMRTFLKPASLGYE